jgi:poly [ADP-ribose] polymerase
VDKYTSEFKNLEAYVKKTQGKTHRMGLTVEEIFRVTRSVEEEHWQNAGWDKLASDNRYLLWHGSRTTNFAGILSQGLRIAPPEAPVNGYMFGKGIYLADIVSKSANYCCAGVSSSFSPFTSLLLHAIVEFFLTVFPNRLLITQDSYSFVRHSLGTPCSN